MRVLISKRCVASGMVGLTILLGLPQAVGAQSITAELARTLESAQAAAQRGDLAQALSDYQHVLAVGAEKGLAPTVLKTAVKGQVQVLRRLGDLESAVQEAELFVSEDTQLLDELRHDLAVSLVKKSLSYPANPRKEMLSKALALLKPIAPSSPRRGADELLVLSRLERPGEVVARYEAKESAYWPRWVLPVVAGAYAQIKEYDKAIALFRQLVAEQPRELELREGLFYSLTDAGKWPEARDVALAASQDFKGTEQGLDASILLVEVHRWAGDRRSALSLAGELVQKSKPSARLSALYGWALLSNDRPNDAQVQFEAALRKDPEYQEARQGLLAVASVLDPQKRTALANELRSSAASAGQLARLEKDLEAQQAAYAYASVRRNRDRDSASVESSIEIGSVALDAHETRIVAERTEVAHTLKDKTVKAEQLAVGVTTQVGATKGLAQVRHVDATGHTGLALKLSTRLNDKLSANASLNTAVLDLPARALDAGVTARNVYLEIVQRLDSGIKLGATSSWTKQSDDNLRTSLSAFLDWTTVVNLDKDLSVNVRAGKDTASRQDVSYFSPKQSSWGEVTAQLSKPLRLGAPRPVRLGMATSLGFVSQDGYNLKPIGSAGVFGSMEIDEGVSVQMAIQRARKVYDGQFNQQTVWNASLYWRMP